MTPNKIFMVIKEATNTFVNFPTKPTNDDMLRMNRLLLLILLKIPYDQVKATHNVSGLFSPSSKYIKNYVTAFQRPTRPKPYSLTINATMSNNKRQKSEATHSARKEDYLLYEADEMGIMHFLTTNVDETCYW